MVFIYGTHVCIEGQYLQAFFSFFFKILIFGIIRGAGVGGQREGKRLAQNPKWQKFLSASLRISGTVHHIIMWLWFGYTFVKWWYLPQIFLFFKILIFWVFKGIKGQKKTLNYQFQYILLYIFWTLDHIIDILIMISTGVFLYFFQKKMQHCVYIKTNLFFIGPLQ